MAAPPPVKLNPLLKEVSRSFYLTIRVLPRAVRSQIGLAYLLARTTDTIADTEVVPINERLQALQSLRERILGVNQKTLDFDKFARCQRVSAKENFLKDCEEAFHDIDDLKLKSPSKVHADASSAERILLERIEEILAMLMRLSPTDRDLIRKVLSIITSGQELDLKRFGNAGPDRIIALLTQEELDDYTWRVAGCVGEFWTRICQTHLFPKVSTDQGRLLSNGVRFGKGLQLVNILRDLPSDLRSGRCYLPAQALSVHGLAPEDLLRPEKEVQFRPVYQLFLNQAQDHLTAGWEYTLELPKRSVRVRLACAWPILIGVKTLARLRTQNVLEPQQRIKISRAEVRGLMARSVLCYPWSVAWARLFKRVSHL